VISVIGVLGTTLPALASATPKPARAHHQLPAAAHRSQPIPPLRRPPLPAGQHYACSAPVHLGQMACMTIVNTKPRTPVGWAVPASTSGNYGPAALRAAYKIATASARNGRGRTIAIVDAYSDPKAAADLNVYRSHYHLGPCTTANHCLRIVNEFGHVRPLPAGDPDWAMEESLDLDMVSAICPKCHILLVEARSPNTPDLGTAENTAIRMGARYVSNSWSGGEFFGQDSTNGYFNHPGDVIDFASGDYGYGPVYPADLQYVTAIGGTSLKHASNRRGWNETAWGAADSSPTPPVGGTGGGCSGLEPKPSWQREDATASGGCLLRTENDVSAVADPTTGVLIYDTYQQSGLFEVGGTSAATPIITSIYALAGMPTRGSYPAEYAYLHARHLFDVTSGLNGKCESFRQYLCHGTRGYDGPTGLGTPNGLAAFTDNSAHRVALVDPGTQDVTVGTSFALTITGLDTTAASAPHWSATGLPTGLTVKAVSNTTNAKITGTLPGSPHTYQVAVTAKDGRVTGTTHFNIVVVPSLSATNPPSGAVTLTGTGFCLDGGTDAVAQPVTIRSCGNPASQDWAYTASASIADTGTLQIAGKCLSLAGTSAVLGNCTGSSQTLWGYLGLGALWNLATGGCLNVAQQAAGTQAKTVSCNFGPTQTWDMPAGPMVGGAGQLCLKNPSFGHVKVAACDFGGGADRRELWTLQGTGLISNDQSGLCLAANGTFSATAVTAESCDFNNLAQTWEPGPGGQMINLGSGKCLADPNSGEAGTTLVQNDCYGDLGEIWGLN
jgi:hypothetical protein